MEQQEQARLITNLIDETTSARYRTAKHATIHGLVIQPQYNGDEVEVLAFDDERCRFQVKMPTGEIKFIKRENLKLEKPFNRLPSDIDGLFAVARELPFYSSPNLQNLDVCKMDPNDLQRLFHHFEGLGL